MSLDRKDLRLYLDAEVHEALAVLADIERVELRELAEKIIHDRVLKEIRAANVIAERTARLGISRKKPD